MKKILLLLVVFILASCSKDDCTQDALCTKMTDGLIASKSTTASKGDMVTICHYGVTIEVDENSLQMHLDHGDELGECKTLSDGGLVFRDGEVVEIPCKYDLPFIHVDDNGAQWLYEIPKN